MRPIISGDRSQVLREGADDLTLRAEEFNSQKACIHVDHINEKFGDRFWWTQIGTPFAKQLTQEFQEVSGKICTIIKEIRVRQLEPKKQVRVRRQRRCGL